MLFTVYKLKKIIGQSYEYQDIALNIDNLTETKISKHMFRLEYPHTVVIENDVWDDENKM